MILPAAPRADIALFGEAPSRFVLSLPEHRLRDFQALAAARSVPLTILGRIGGDRLRLAASTDHRWAIDLPLAEIAAAYDALSSIL